MSRRFIAVIPAVIALVAVMLLQAPANAVSYSSPCYNKANWNTAADNSGSSLSSNKISGFAAGRQSQGCDRLVITLRGTRAVSFRAHYGAVYQDGSGTRVHVAGAYDFSLAVWAWPRGVFTSTTSDDFNVRAGRVLYPTTNPKGLVRVEQVKAAGAHEGITQFAVGLDAKKPFRVFVLRDYANGVTKVVVEFRHR